MKFFHKSCYFSGFERKQLWWIFCFKMGDVLCGLSSQKGGLSPDFFWSVNKNAAGSAISHEKLCLLFCFIMAYISRKFFTMSVCAPRAAYPKQNKTLFSQIRNSPARMQLLFCFQ
jgi:hypothetical protein